MRQIYVIDTNAIIYYYSDLFGQPSQLSMRASQIIRHAFKGSSGLVGLSIPSIVFVELYRKWLRSEEFARRFYYDVFRRCEESPNIEIRTIEKETIENLIMIRGSLANHEIHDKLILASAITLSCPLITLDRKIIEYVEATRVIPDVIN